VRQTSIEAAKTKPRHMVCNQNKPNAEKREVSRKSG
jgi:hypothetical protein